jgi:hypothetical protein
VANTCPRILFGDTEFVGTDFISAKLVEEFSPLSITLPVSALEFSIFSDDVAFSIINPTGDFEQFATQQPVSLYEIVDGTQVFLGQFYLEDWSNKSENVKNFTCVDILGVLDKYEYMGGIWLTAVTVADLVADVLDAIGVVYDIDPDLAIVELTGWLPIMTVREALQQIAFAAGAYVLSPRQNSIVMGRLTQVSQNTNGIRCGVAASDQSRVWGMRWRGAQSYVFTSTGYTTTGLRSGVGKSDQSRVWQRKFRPSQWENIQTTLDIPSTDQAGRKVTLRPQVTGVEVIGHDIVAGDGTLELLNQAMVVGTHEIHFSQPVHTLSITGGTITESGANYAVINVATAGTVVLAGLVYVVTDTLYGEYLPPSSSRKDNIVKITDATLVTSGNGATICLAVFDYYQQRYRQNFKMFAPGSSARVGATVNLETLYSNYLYGVIEKMTTNLTGGAVADTEVVGIIL